MASAMSTLEEIAKWYLEDRKKTRGLTGQGELTIKGHLGRLVKASGNRIPTKEQGKDFLGKHTPGARPGPQWRHRRLFRRRLRGASGDRGSQSLAE